MCRRQLQLASIPEFRNPRNAPQAPTKPAIVVDGSKRFLCLTLAGTAAPKIARHGTILAREFTSTGTKSPKEHAKLEPQRLPIRPRSAILDQRHSERALHAF